MTLTKTVCGTPPGLSHTTRLRPSAPIPIQPDAEYRWVVEALDRDGEARMTSPPQAFSVRRD